ncbi:hypothetical protein CIY_04110 [Butyrivibrio fibrisolvens 16/4]|nr:hypothetical protein CIY_04110 [Butyrivibrio fibrisolvens 16/4]
MYCLEMPLRIAKRNNGQGIVTFPKSNYRFEVNQNVIELFEYLKDENGFEDSVIDEYTYSKNIMNTEDYRRIYEQLKTFGLVRKA